MAVYTKIERAQLIDFLDDYNIGTLESFAGIPQGVSNTNYHVYTDRGHYILTLFEEHRTDPAGLPFFFGFSQHLAAQGIPCPEPMADNEGNLSGRLAGKAASFMTFLEGQHVKETDLTAAHCYAAGQLAAAMHLAAQDFFPQRANGMGIAAWKSLTAKAAGRCDGIEAGLEGLIASEISFLEKNWPRDLPRGAVHADIFPDNVLFEGAEITGILDFYFSCTDFFVYDLAIAINAWCFDAQNKFSPERFESLMKGYGGLRELTAAERKSLPLMCRAAAMRILATRTHDMVFHDPKALVRPHDPREYSAKLRFHQNEKIGR